MSSAPHRLRCAGVISDYLDSPLIPYIFMEKCADDFIASSINAILCPGWI